MATRRPARILSLAAPLLVGLLCCGGEPDRCALEEPGVLCPLAGTGDIGFNGDGLPAEQTELNLLSKVARGPDGRIYLMDFNNYRLRVIDEAGVIQTVAGSGVHGFADTAVDVLSSPLENPIDFDFMPDGRLVLVSYHDPRVLVLEDDGRLHPIAGDGEVGDIGDGGPALEAEFTQLDGIVITDDGTIFVSDSLANRVRRIQDGIVTTVAGTGERGYSGDGGPGEQAELSWPTALDVDRDGNLYFTEKYNGVLRRLRTDGTIETLAGTGTTAFSGDGGPAVEAQLNWPDGVVVDDDGTIYVSDGANFRVRKITADGIIQTIAGSGDKGLEGLGGPAEEAELGFLSRISMDGRTLLIADQSNSCARRLFLAD